MSLKPPNPEKRLTAAGRQRYEYCPGSGGKTFYVYRQVVWNPVFGWSTTNLDYPENLNNSTDYEWLDESEEQ